MPAVGTSLFMQVSGQADGDSEGDLLEFLQIKKSEARLSQLGKAVSTLIVDRKMTTKQMGREVEPAAATGKVAVRRSAVKKEVRASSVQVERVVKREE